MKCRPGEKNFASFVHENRRLRRLGAGVGGLLPLSLVDSFANFSVT